MTSLDIVIPVYNEEDVLPLLFKELDLTFNAEALEKHGLETPHYIFVDDGSKDQSKRIIREAIDGGLNASLLSLTRNFGHQSAVTAGLSLSRAQITALIDSDLQDPPQVILEMVDKWRQGYEVIYGVRRQRKEGKIKVFCYWFFYRILSFLSEVDIAKDSGDFCLIDQKVVSTMNKLPEKLRFPRGLRAWVGYKQWGA
jgi:glycosyltransferase involved in cell wall biosynthesis